jgi:peptide/nickel transport system permease protein
MGTATSAMDKITFWNFGLPVLTIALYGIGYIARMTRASMTEVMTQQYIRTARLKGVAFRDVVMRHALRNALIAPFTVIMLQFPWLLNGVVIVPKPCSTTRASAGRWCKRQAITTSSFCWLVRWWR